MSRFQEALVLLDFVFAWLSLISKNILPHINETSVETTNLDKVADRL